MESSFCAISNVSAFLPEAVALGSRGGRLEAGEELMCRTETPPSNAQRGSCPPRRAPLPPFALPRQPPLRTGSSGAENDGETRLLQIRLVLREESKP